jgi:hypothetical protein
MQHYEIITSGFEVIENGKAIIRIDSDGKTYWEHREIKPEDSYWVVVNGKNYHYNKRETALRFNEENRLKVPWPKDVPKPEFMRSARAKRLLGLLDSMKQTNSLAPADALDVLKEAGVSHDNKKGLLRFTSDGSVIRVQALIDSVRKPVRTLSVLSGTKRIKMSLAHAFNEIRMGFFTFEPIPAITTKPKRKSNRMKLLANGKKAKASNIT